MSERLYLHEPNSEKTNLLPYMVGALAPYGLMVASALQSNDISIVQTDNNYSGNYNSVHYGQIRRNRILWENLQGEDAYSAGIDDVQQEINYILPIVVHPICSQMHPNPSLNYQTGN